MSMKLLYIIVLSPTNLDKYLYMCLCNTHWRSIRCKKPKEFKMFTLFGRGVGSTGSRHTNHILFLIIFHNYLF